MRARVRFTALLLLLTACGRGSIAEEVDDDAFHLQMVQRKLPRPETMEELTAQVARMRRVGASNSEIAERMSVVIDKRLEATNKPQGESLFNPLKKGEIAERKRKWQEVDDQFAGRDGRAGKPVDNGRTGAGLAEIAWKNKVGNCSESANVAFETLRRAGIPAHIFNVSTGGAHEFVVIGLAPNADPNDPGTWGDDARVVDGWIGRSLTPEEAFKNPHIFNGKTTNPKGEPLIQDQTTAFYDPKQEKAFEELGNRGFLKVSVEDEAGKAVPGATIRILGEPLQEMPSTVQGIANFKSYPGKALVEVSPPEKSGLKSGRGESYVESKRIMSLTVVLKKKPADFKIAITSPADGTKVQDDEITVAGTVSDPEVQLVAITLGGSPIMTAVKDKQFSAAVKLKKGENVIRAEAEQAASNPVTVTLAKRSEWDGIWKGKTHLVTVSNGKTTTKDDEQTFELSQAGDTLIMKIEGGKHVSKLKIDPKSPNVVTHINTGKFPESSTSRGGGYTQTVTWTLRDGRVYARAITDTNYEIRGNESLPWVKYTSHGDQKGEFDREE